MTVKDNSYKYPNKLNIHQCQFPKSDVFLLKEPIVMTCGGGAYYFRSKIHTCDACACTSSSSPFSWESVSGSTMYV